MADNAAQQIDEPSIETGGRVHDAIVAITRHIRENRLMPGDSLPSEMALSRDLGVSRSVVREAVQSLAAMRLITQNAGRRSTVAPLDTGAMAPLIEHGVNTDQISITQIYDVRRTIEVRIAALAALRRTDDEAARLVALTEAMARDVDAPPKVMEHDIAFHRLLAEASRNPVFAMIVGAFSGVTRQTWPIGWRSRMTAAARNGIVGIHIDLARAIQAGEPDTATRLMGTHFDESVRALLDAGLA